MAKYSQQYSLGIDSAFCNLRTATSQDLCLSRAVSEVMEMITMASLVLLYLVGLDPARTNSIQYVCLENHTCLPLSLYEDEAFDKQFQVSLEIEKYINMIS